MSTKHTPGPWYLRVKAGRVYVTAERTDIVTAERTDIASMIRQEASAEMLNNADFIVRACNNHEALLAALRDLYTECDAWQHEELDGHPTWGPIMRAARAAIAACEAQP